MDYKIPGTDYTIPKGMAIIISLLGFGRDPKYFPNPETFDPDRFLPETQNFNPNAYIPFGDGPRACIGKYFFFIIKSYLSL